MAQSRDKGLGRWRWRKVLLVINIPVTLAFIMSILAQFVSPVMFWPLIFFGLAFPFILAAQALVTFLWFVRSWKAGMANIIILLCGFTAVRNTVGIGCQRPQKTQKGAFKVMTYNVRLFDYYNWSRNIHTRHWMYDFLNNQQPDILCIQEFFHDNTGYFPTIDTLRKVNSIKHMHLENYQKLKVDQMWGMATLSRFPIVGRGRIEFPGTFGNMAIFTDVLINQDTVRIYNVHLQSVRFDWDDYKSMDKLLDTKDLGDYTEGKKLLIRIQDATVKRAGQAEMVAAHLAQCPYPVIVCGDLNDTPVSYAYRTLTYGLRDTFRNGGCGLGSTYVKLPVLRIDGIWHSLHLTSDHHTVHPYELSDHLAVSAMLKINVR